MLQTVLQDGTYGFFTQAALVLFFGAFLVILLTTFSRSRSQTDRFSRMPLSDDQDLEPTTGSPNHKDHGADRS